MTASNEFVVELESTALPATLECEQGITLNEAHQAAYSRARDIEKLGQWPTLPPSSSTISTTDMSWPDKLKPVNAGRLLGYLLIEAHSQTAADTIAKEINSCDSGQSKDLVHYYLADLARIYSMTLLKTCRCMNRYRT